MSRSAVKSLIFVISLVLVSSILAHVVRGIADDLISNYILSENHSSVKQEVDTSRTVIIDPGHGGEDPGAVGLSGTLEKDINLSLSKILKEILTIQGFSVIMTRQDDVLLYDPEATGSKKAQDLRSRVDIAKQYPDALFVSIHMNKFPLESCQGLQVYYSANHPMGATFAAIIRDSVRATLQPSNNREVKKATSDIFILHRIEIPAVLIECGFLSNPEEESKLTTKEYQSALAMAIALSVEEYFNSVDANAGKT